MTRSDEYLLELALQGDDGSFGELARRWQRRIFGFICRYVGNHEEAQDLTQDTFTKAFQNLNRLTDPTRFSSWVYKIALNECRMRFRKESKVRRVPLDEYIESDLAEVDDRTPETTLASKQASDSLQQAFRELPDEQRTVILMKEFQGLKFHEIAEILDVPLSTVKSRMYLGLKTLKRLMEKKV